LEAYQKSSSTNENFWQAKFNQATIEYLQGQYERALATLVSIETGSSNELIVLLSKAILNIELAKKDSSYLSSSEDLFFNLHRYSRKTSEFRQEAFLLMMAYYTLRKQSEQATGVLGEFLDSDPYSTDEYIQDLLIDKRIVNWQNLKKICDATLPLLANSPQVQAANALCHTKAGEELKAKSFISVALARAPKDAQVLALSSFLNRESGRDMEARANLKMSTQIGLSKLNASLQARLCEAENQAACAKEYWQKLLSFDANSIEALNGLAWLGYNSRNQEESRKNMERGLLISGSYRPLLELRETGSL
ncbi:MAG: tetratricopeptide repeat protein, partial [Pseudobdellovibrionaceae bacterium]